MKISITLFIAVYAFFLNTAQAQDYQLTLLFQEYKHLEEPIIVENGIWDDFDDEQTLEFPIGFDFELFDVVINTLYISGDFSEVILATAMNENENASFIMPYLADMISRTDENDNILSSISYKLEGEEGGRIFKVEWRDIGFYGDTTGNDFVNFQVWLYEGSDDIEFHYGAFSLTQPLDDLFDLEAGPGVGLVSNYDYQNIDGFEFALLLEGNSGNPSIVMLEDDQDFPIFITGQPTAGLVYHFSKDMLDAAVETKVLPLQFFPTLVEYELILEIEDVLMKREYQIVDLTGKIVVPRTMLKSKIINLSHLQAGMYFINLFNDKKMSNTGRFIKK